MTGHPRSRLRRVRISLRSTLAISIAGTLASYLCLRLVGMDLSNSLAIAGIVFGVCSFALAELHRRDSPRKPVVYLGQEDATFNANIVEGLRQELMDGFAHTLSVLTPPPSNTQNTVGWQLEQLELPKVRDSAALVIAPTRDEERIWTALRRIRERGTCVVVVDVEPPATIYSDHSVPPPAFVGSDFKMGGKAIGGVLASQLREDPSAIALVCLGPDWSRPGASRSSWLLYVLALEGLLDRTYIHQLWTWEPMELIDGLFDRVVSLLKPDGGSVVVFSGDDRIMFDLDRRLGRCGDALTSRIRLVGYDGIISASGRYLAADCTMAIATLDARLMAQGREAARLLREVHGGATWAGAVRREVEPQVVVGPDWQA